MLVRRFRCLFLRETHTKRLLVRFPMRPEKDEGRKVRESTEVNRRDQSSRPKAAEQRRRQNRPVDGTRQSAGESRRLLGCMDSSRVGQREKMNQHSW